MSGLGYGPAGDESWFRPPPGRVTRPGPGAPPARTAKLLATLGYAGVAVLGVVAPLAVLAVAFRSAFVRGHAVQALNIALTWLLYLISGAVAAGVLALVSVAVALAIMIPVTVAGWAFLVTLLSRCVMAARRGEFHQPPRWACATFFGRREGT